MRGSVASVHSPCTSRARMADKKEPQSYGSQGDWVSGHTGQKPNPEQPGSFDEHRENDASAPHQGGDTSPVQSREHAMPSGPPTDSGAKVTDRRAARSAAGISRRGITRGRSSGCTRGCEARRVLLQRNCFDAVASARSIREACVRVSGSASKARLFARA